MILFKEIPRSSLLEQLVLFWFQLSQSSQQLRLGSQAHAPTNSWFSMVTITKCQQIKVLGEQKAINEALAEHG
jgi:polyphosphate kinase 2 (PPK2 family)